MTTQLQTHIAELLDILKLAKPQKVILFGSATSPNLRPDRSDLDICLLKSTNQPIYKEKTAVWKLLSQHSYHYVTDIDLHIYSPETFQTYLQQQDPFVTEINKTGQIIYESH